ncbi:MAG TPA: AAA domain-containing protein, partial [Terriglobia bacterium]|nr:AAA domain-containing protein [Terriglobia bacterium]
HTLVDVRIVADEEPFTFEFDHEPSELQNGDAVLIHSGKISSLPTFHGHVRNVEGQRVRVFIPLKNLDVAAFSGQLWIIDRFPSDVTAEASHTALSDFLQIGVRPLVSLFPKGNRETRGLTPIFNESQREAIEKACGCGSFHLIWGPPGTGKTKVIPEIIRNTNGSVLLGAFTNTAVDKMLHALLDADPNTRFLRIGRAADSPELAARLANPAEYFSDDLAKVHLGIHQVRRAMDGAPIVAATAHRACTMPYLRQRRFEMAIVDEAGQLTEPLTLGLILRGRRFVLVGDDRQLPPVVRTRGLARSMFERLKQEAEAANSSAITLLDVQYRMHPQIMSVSNRFFYDGRLKSGVTHDDRVPPDEHAVVFVPVEPAEAHASDARRNPAEAEVVSQLVKRYVRTLGVPPENIGVVSPFRAQVALLRKTVRDVGVTVDTVERFQGGERDIMILSLVRPQGSDFVFDERRFNVAITRARRKLILVAHPNLFRNSRYQWLSEFAEKGNF